MVSGIVLILSLTIVLVSWYYRDDLFQTIYDPRTPFQTYQPPPPVDYTTVDGWLLRPDPQIDPIKFDGAADIFVIAPTVFLGRKHWNAPLEDDKVSRDFKRVVLPNYVLPFQNSGRVYAPKYRQAALYAFLTARDDARAAQKFAYQDVKRAFKVFLQESPPERPIVLVGYGQGGLHAIRLLRDEMDKAAQKKLAIAYIIDHPLPLDLFEGPLSAYHPCKDENDTGCIVAFGAFSPNEAKRARYFVERTLVWKGRRLKTVAGRKLLCTNPLIWNSSEDYAPARLHLGGVAAAGLEAGDVPAPSPKQTGAQCQDGILLIDRPKQKSLRRPSRFGGKFRTLESNLFYEDLRVDAQRRVQNLIEKDLLPKRAPLLDMETVEIVDSPVTLPLEPVKQ
ncbi:MAG TPA: DUF3089 domain-containing protein [Hellea balneolensis]|uniref:DUF3089 domain-containing protein n=1 Tax=Hellea balneolensis TaxID=287478 RepID=A0A7C5LSP5_9PROT|nr:DUF3089 domain-containing protein [Hellea balneolensis]